MSVFGFSRELRRQIQSCCYASGLMTALCMLSACSITSASDTNKTWLHDGVLALSRPVPPAKVTGETASPRASLRPVSADLEQSAQSSSIVISRTDKTLTALSPNSAPIVIKSEGAQYLPQGSYSVTVKEENSLWYAPKEYYLRRSMSVPQEGSRDRFRRAALGPKTIFLNDHTPIHSGPVWMQEIGGVRLSSGEMQQVFSLISVGTRVEVR
jgi:hypothetical protein